MTSYLPLTCLAVTLAGCRRPAWCGSLPAVPVPLEPAEAPRDGSLATAGTVATSVPLVGGLVWRTGVNAIRF